MMQRSKQSSPRGRRTSWQSVHQWYNDIVGEKGHYFHQTIILPGSLRLLQLRDGDSLLDLACGQGVLARTLPEQVSYVGVDAARSLIEAAQELDHATNHFYAIANLERPTLGLERVWSAEKKFSHAAIILALQNIAHPERVLSHAVAALQPGGKFLLVLNHPCFRIPRQSSWGVDETKKTQYRRVDRYLSPLEIPIQAHPGQQQSSVTWSYHHPLATYIQLLSSAGFVVTQMEEWASEKISQGKAAKMENRSRAEIPLFLAILAEKRSDYKSEDPAPLLSQK